MKTYYKIKSEKQIISGVSKTAALKWASKMMLETDKPVIISKSTNNT